eukprot:COSAG04_NODE_13328_length_610_cov_50.088063_1_plen_181_part_01
MCAAKCRSGRRTSRRDTWRRSSQVRPPRPGSVLRPPRSSPCPTVTPAVSREPGVSSADSVRMSLGLGHAQHPTLTDAQQRVEEMQQSAIKAVHDAREDALSRISEFSAAVLPAQPLAASNGSAAQPPTGAGNAAAAGTGLLHAAAAAGRASAVLRCMESEPDVNVLDKRGRSALWLAASRG